MWPTSGSRLVSCQHDVPGHRASYEIVQAKFCDQALHVPQDRNEGVRETGVTARRAVAESARGATDEHVIGLDCRIVRVDRTYGIKPLQA